MVFNLVLNEAISGSHSGHRFFCWRGRKRLGRNGGKKETDFFLQLSSVYIFSSLAVKQLRTLFLNH